MSEQYMTDVKGDLGGRELVEEASSSSLISQTGTVERHGRDSHSGGGAKQRLNSISSAASVPSPQRGRLGGGHGGGGGEEASPSHSAASNFARRPQRVLTVGRSRLHKSTAKSAATQETSDVLEN